MTYWISKTAEISNKTVHTNAGVVLFFIVVFLCVCMTAALLILHKKQLLNIKTYFLASAISLGLVYMLIFPVWTIPDAKPHFAAAYRFSSILLGHSGSEEWTGRKEDAQFSGKYRRQTEKAADRNPAVAGYAVLAQNAHILVRDNALTEMPLVADHMKFYSFINYFPLIAGLFLGRFLHLSAVFTVYLARLFGLAFFVWGGHRAIKNTPVGKSLFAMIPLFPISLMFASAFSYDGMLMICGLNFIASVLAYSRDFNNKNMLAEALIWTFMLAATKGGGGLLLLPVALILLQSDDMKGSAKRIGSIVGTAALSLFIFDLLIPAGSALFQFGSEGGPNLSAGFALAHPGAFLRMAFMTYRIYTDDLVFNMIGSSLAILEYVIPHIVIATLFVCGCIIALYERDHSDLRPGERPLFFAIVIASIFITPVMLLSYTPANLLYINGLQGRYFLPELPLLVLAVTKGTLRPPFSEKENAPGGRRSKIIRTAVILGTLMNLVSVYYMLKLYLSR